MPSASALLSSHALRNKLLLLLINWTRPELSACLASSPSALSPSLSASLLCLHPLSEYIVVVSLSLLILFVRIYPMH
jgi:hypothetical protein